MDFAAFVLEQLHRPSRILEVGCGAGDLSRALAAAGHDVVAIDPEAPEGPLFRKTTFETFGAPPRSFDCVVMHRVLHHLPHLDAALDKVAELVRSDGRLVVYDFAKERMDERAAEWYWERWRTLGETRHGLAPSDAATFLEDWRTKKREMHSGAEMREALARHFEQGHFAWEIFCTVELGDAAGEQLERAAVERADLSAIGFTYVGVLEDI